MKRPFQQLGRVGSVGAAKAPMIRRPFRSAPLQITQTLPICAYCQKEGHTQQECRRANGLCLICGSGDHIIESCPYKRTGIMNRTLPVPPTPIRQRNPGQWLRGALFLRDNRFSTSPKGNQNCSRSRKGTSL